MRGIFFRLILKIVTGGGVFIVMFGGVMLAWGFLHIRDPFLRWLIASFLVLSWPSFLSHMDLTTEEVNEIEATNPRRDSIFFGLVFFVVVSAGCLYDYLCSDNVGLMFTMYISWPLGFGVAIIERGSRKQQVRRAIQELEKENRLLEDANRMLEKKVQLLLKMGKQENKWNKNQ